MCTYLLVMNVVYILLGGNEGDPKKKLAAAKKEITKNIGNIIRLSSLYKTAAWGITDQPDFLNQVIIINTKYTAEETLFKCLAIEEKMGRIRTIKNAPRIIDIDLLFCNKEIINTKALTIPHPQMQNRRFVLIPLNELSPNLKHPVLHKTIHQLLTICPDNLEVQKI